MPFDTTEAPVGTRSGVAASGAPPPNGAAMAFDSS